MAEYWKSQPRKLCEFCKCWITDNRPSVEFHERGKKHKENVQKRIEEVQKKGKETFQVRKQLATDLAAIEAAALKAYEKDLNIESSEDKSNSTPESESRPTSTKSHTKGESTAECLISYEGSKPVLQCDHGWSIGQAPEGHYYYYNTETQVSQWVPPSCLSSPSGQESRNSEDSKTCSDEQQKPPQEDVEEIKDNQRSEKVKKSPYGQWTTVQTYTPPPKTEVATSTQEKEPTIKTPATEVVKTEVKFKERATPKIAFKSDGANEVTFKKRKLNSEKKRNVRQTDPNKVN